MADYAFGSNPPYAAAAQRGIVLSKYPEIG
jgi:hypothetical protein